MLREFTLLSGLYGHGQYYFFICSFVSRHDTGFTQSQNTFSAEKIKRPARKTNPPEIDILGHFLIQKISDRPKSQKRLTRPTQ